MPTILAISGSLRRESYNTMLLHAAVELAPAGANVDVATIRGIPLYDGDVEASGPPPSVVSLKDRVASAGGLLLVTPEYNNSIPGVFKNAIDWLSRPPQDSARVFGGLPVGVIGATPGPGGTALSQAAWLPVLRTLGTIPFCGARVMISNAGGAFSDGKLVDAQARTFLEKYMAAFSAFVGQHGRR